MERDIDSIDLDPISKQKDIDLFASFMSDEMRMEVRRLRNEQTLFQKEIEQLRQERDMLFDILQKSQTTEQQMNPELPTLTFSSPSAFSIAAQDVEPPVVAVAAAATQTPAIQEPQGTVFSKDLMLEEIRKYEDNKTFRKASDIISRAKSGDAIVKYFTNACGSAMTAMEREIDLLKEELLRAQNRRRRALADSVRSLTAAKTEQLKLKCAMLQLEE